MVELLPVTTWPLCVTRCILWTRCCFLTLMQFFQDDNLHTHTATSVQSWLEQHEDALQHLPWPAQSSDLNIIETLWSVLESSVRSRSLLHHLSSNQKMFMMNGTVLHWRLFRTYMTVLQEGHKLYYRQTVAQLCSIFHSRFTPPVNPSRPHTVRRSVQIHCKALFRL